MKLVLIEWVDSHGLVDGWNVVEQDTEPELLVCESVGWLLYDGKECKTIMPHRAGHKSKDIALQGRGVLNIPQRAILKFTELKH